MIVKCAHCGPLPYADLETLGRKAWAKHLDEHHRDRIDRAFAITDTNDEALLDALDRTAHSDGGVCA